MKKVLIYFLGIMVLIVTVGCHPLKQPEPRKLVRISVLPVYSLETMAKRYISLIEYLSKETGFRIEFVSSLSYSDFLSVVETARVDIAFANPFIYQILVNTKKAYPLVQAVNPDGEPVYRGIIIAHRDSGITKITDLQNKMVMVASRKSLAGYLGQAKTLKDAGIDPEKDLRLIVGGRQEDILFKVYKKKVDAGFVSESVIKEVSDKIDIKRIKIVARTEEFPEWVFIAFGDTPPDVAAKIKEALLKLTADDKTQANILKEMGVQKFIPPTMAKFDAMAKLIKTLNLPY